MDMTFTGNRQLWNGQFWSRNIGEEKYYNGFDQRVARQQFCKHEYRQQ
jgi:hypothetical protein